MKCSQEDCEFEATHGYCPYADNGSPHPSPPVKDGAEESLDTVSSYQRKFNLDYAQAFNVKTFFESKDRKTPTQADVLLAQGEANGLEFKVQALEAENQRLREALENIVALADKADPYDMASNCELNMLEIAKFALSDGKGGV